MEDRLTSAGAGTPNPLATLLEHTESPRILVLGDVMLDRYLWGDVERISPEAPIPVLRVNKEEHRLGGAGNVAAMLSALDARPDLAALVGDDREGLAVRDILEKLDVDTRGVLIDEERQTTVKERLLGRSQQRYPHHMMRIDREDTTAISATLADSLLAYIESCLDSIQIVMISDYNKGVCAGDVIPRTIALARRAGVPVLADPVRDADYHRYSGCTCITPNRVEAGLAARMKIVTPQDGLEAAERLLQYGVEAAAVTMDRDGIAWADVHGNRRHFPTKPRQVCDVTGAGDMVLSAMGYCMALGADYATTMEASNLAGGLEVERLGVVPLTRRDLLAEISHGTSRTDYKILSLQQLQTQLQRHRQAGHRIAMTNGCFDLLHPGHVASLQEARRQGDCLVVGLNSDRSVRDLKGPSRPIVDQQGRAEMLAALACVDYVVIFDEASVEGLVAQILPDVLVKASQYSTERVVGHKTVTVHGGHVVSVPMKPHYSTTSLIQRVKSTQAE
jgi:D-beta-D-heptose 7-phosphate kinase/D-beta-D-heptose 1-phosphate adenosyltransferase